MNIDSYARIFERECSQCVRQQMGADAAKARNAHRPVSVAVSVAESTMLSVWGNRNNPEAESKIATLLSGNRASPHHLTLRSF